MPYLVDFFDRIPLVYAKRFDSEHPIMTFLIGVPPDISESPKRECSLAGRLAERESNFVTGGKNPT